METQSLPTLRPLRLGELLDQSIRLYRRNFLTFVGIIALVYVPLKVVQIASTTILSSLSAITRFNPQEQAISNLYGGLGIIFLAFVVLFLQYIFVQGTAAGAMARAVANSYLGKSTSILDAYRGIGKSWISLIGALLFVGLLIIVALLWWIIVPCVGWFTGFGMLTFLGAAISPMVAPVIVLEGKGAIDAVRRAWSLVRRRFWPILGYIFILYLFNWIIVRGPVTITSVLLTQISPASFTNTTTGVVINAIIQGVVSIVFILIYYPLQMTAVTLIYFDLRVRTEGFDLTLIATGDANQALTALPTQENERLITGADMGNFAILTLAAVGLYILFVAFAAMGIFLIGALSGL